MTVSERIKATDNKIDQNKAQYNLHRQVAKVSVLSLRNFGKYKFLTDEDVSPEKHLSEKVAPIKIFVYSPFCSE